MCWHDGAMGFMLLKKKKKQSWDVKQGHLRQSSMPGQNMYNLALVYPLAFKLLQIYFPPIKFFMRQYWLCSLVLPQQNGAGGSNLTELPPEWSSKSPPTEFGETSGYEEDVARLVLT